MATRAVVGNISGEATTPAGNILVEAMRGIRLSDISKFTTHQC